MSTPWNRLRHLFGLTTVLVVAGTATAAVLTEDFSGMRTGVCYPDGGSAGMWQFVYNGYGCTDAVNLDSNIVLREKPLSSTAPGETHASLVLGPSVSGDLSLGVSILTAQQLRVNGASNAWEVGWVLWHFADNARFYYFIAKPNGWELGKADPAYPGGQRFLATGSSPTFPPGAWYRAVVVQNGATIDVSVDGRRLVQFTDSERPYSSGRIGLYNEDAEVLFDDVSVTTLKKAGGKKGR